MHLQYLIVWETCSREDGYFLASGDAVHAIDGGYASLDHLLRVDTTLRVYRLTCNMRTTQAGNSGVSLCVSLCCSWVSSSIMILRVGVNTLLFISPLTFLFISPGSFNNLWISSHLRAGLCVAFQSMYQFTLHVIPFTVRKNKSQFGVEYLFNVDLQHMEKKKSPLFFL